MGGAGKPLNHPTTGQSLLSIPFVHDAVKLLRNLGYNAPAPIEYLYDWCGNTPWDAQRATAAMLTMEKRAYVLNEMGTGKTRAALWAADYLIKNTKPGTKALVIAPLSTLDNVWDDEIMLHFQDRTTAILHGPADKRRKLLEKDSDIYIINHHGLQILQKELIQRLDIQIVIIDELAVFRNKRTDLWKSANQVCNNKKAPKEYVWGMTGSPTPGEPTDAWAQCKLITPWTVPTWFKDFRDMTMTKITQFKWVPKPDWKEKVYEVMQPAVRFKRVDCDDIPPVTYSSRKIELSRSQQHFYKQVMDKLYVMFQNHEITAANEAVKIGKLLQIASGFVYTDKQGIVSLGAKKRFRELCDIIDSSVEDEHGGKTKTIVFAPFRHCVDQIHGELCRAGYDAAKIHGDVPKGQRTRIFTLFQKSATYEVLVAYPETMAHGLTLTRADTIVWYGPIQSLEIYEQANARITRPSQKHHQHIIHFESTPIEKQVFSRLQRKAAQQGALLEMFEQIAA